jgi:hypothetical protein
LRPARRYNLLAVTPTEEVERLTHELDELEGKFKDALGDLKSLRQRWSDASRERERKVRSAWTQLDHKWFFIVLAATSFFFILSFFVYSEIGWYHDRSPLPTGADPLLSRLPIINLVPVLAYGWLICHVAALYLTVAYEPRRLPYLLSTVGLFIVIRSIFVSLSPYGPPLGMLNLNASYVFAPLRGVLAFDNEFFFSGHTSLPYLYFLFYHGMPRARKAFLAASVVMAACVLLTRNHYTMDVLGAYFMTYAIYRLSRYTLGWLDPLPDRTGAD